MKIDMEIRCKIDFDVVKLIKINSIVQFEHTYVVEKYISVGGYYPIVYLHKDRLHKLLYGKQLFDIANIFSSDVSIDYIFDILSKYAEYDIINVTSYNKDSHYVITEEGYEVELI